VEGYTSDDISNIPYVENRYRTASVPSTPAQNSSSFWPTPSTESRVNDTSLHYRDQRTGSIKNSEEKKFTAQTQGLDEEAFARHGEPFAMMETIFEHKLKMLITISRKWSTPQVLAYAPMSLIGWKRLSWSLSLG